MSCFWRKSFWAAIIPLGLFPLALYPETAQQSFPAPFWKNMRKIALVEEIRQEQINKELGVDQFNTLKSLLDLSLLKDHFLDKFQSSAKEPKSQDEIEQQMKKISGFASWLLEARPKEIKKLLSQAQFTRSEKNLILATLISNRRLGETAFDLIKLSGLSLDSAIFISSSHSFQGFKGVLTVLSYQLAATGDLRVIKKLLKRDFNPNIKTLAGENILHTFISLNHIRRLQGAPKSPDYRESLALLAQKFPQALQEETNLGATPAVLAAGFGDREAFSELTKQISLLPKKDKEKPLKAEKKLKANFTGKNSKSEKGETLVYFDFEPFIKNLFLSVSMGYPEPADKSTLGQLYLLSSNNLKAYEIARGQALVLYLRSKDEEHQYGIRLLKAVLNKDERAFEKLAGESRQELTRLNWIQDEPAPVFISDLLLEAIRHSFFPGVRLVLQRITQFDKSAKDAISLSLDPMSLALVTYASLDEEQPEKKEAKEIINLLIESQSLIENYPSATQFAPLTWAVLLGLLDETKLLIEKQKAELAEEVLIANSNFTMGIIDYAKLQGFMNLAGYLAAQGEDLKPEGCQKAFLN